MNSYSGKVDRYPELQVLRLLSGENGVRIIRSLSNRGMGFNELMRDAEIPSAKTLSNTLKKLIANGILRKEIVSISPLSASYTLTEKGHEVGRMLSAIRDFSYILAK